MVKRFVIGLCLLGLIYLAACWGVAQEEARVTDRRPAEPGALAVAHDEPQIGESGVASGTRPAAVRRREGERFEGRGRFVWSGERISFKDIQSETSFRVLENLALERVVRLMEDPSGLGQKRIWQVAGHITEFRGANFLLLERAVLTAEAVEKAD
ncbi:MAG: hypothetical protein KatS3mg110_2754 [Pirellulaceae bacterium]|nr:MAG: hypothetical protein KatS3mg110_2754 [Pirellulaceae bacterium]